MAMVTTSAAVMGEVQIFHKETLTNPTDNIHNVGDFAAVITTAKKIPSSRQILSYWEKNSQTGNADFATVAHPWLW